MGVVRGMKRTSKDCGSCGDGVTGCDQIDKGYIQRVWFLGWGNRGEGYQQRVWFFWRWGNRVWSEG